MLVGCGLLTVNDALIKWVTQDAPIAQSMFVRGVFVIFPIMLLAWREGGRGGLRIRRWDLQIARGMLTIVSTFLYLSAIGLMPLADAIAITFASPLILTALAPWFLGEEVGWRRRAAVALGFVGVVVMFRPGHGSLSLVVLIPLGVAVSECFRDLVTRRMVSSESSASMTMVSSVMVTAAGGLVAMTNWQPLSMQMVAVLALAGVLMAGAHFLMVEAFRYAEAAVAAPFRYSSVLWALVLGVVLFGDWPDAWMLSGCAIVVMSGVFILQRELQLAAKGRAAP